MPSRYLGVSQVQHKNETGACLECRLQAQRLYKDVRYLCTTVQAFLVKMILLFKDSLEYFQTLQHEQNLHHLQFASETFYSNTIKSLPCHMKLVLIIKHYRSCLIVWKKHLALIWCPKTHHWFNSWPHYNVKSHRRQQEVFKKLKKKEVRTAVFNYECLCSPKHYNRGTDIPPKCWSDRTDMDLDKEISSFYLVCAQIHTHVNTSSKRNTTWLIHFYHSSIMIPTTMWGYSPAVACVSVHVFAPDISDLKNFI